MNTPAAVLLLFASFSLRGEIVLSPRPDGAAVIGPALDAAPPGSVIRLQKGIYREIVTIRKPVSLRGDEGAIVDPSLPFRSKWEPAGTFGPGVYRATVDRAPAALFLDGQVLAQVDPRRREALRDGPWHWKRLVASGTPRTGFHMIRGLWLYLREERAILVHLEDNADPSQRSWSAVWTEEPVISIRKTGDVLVSGLTVAHGSSGVAITDGCQRCALTHCRIGPWDRNGVMLRNGAAASLVENNEIFRGSYEDMTPQTVLTPQGVLAISPDWYEIWRLHKETGFYDRVGISLTLSGSGNRLHANHVHDVFDGINLGEGEIETLDAPVSDPSHDRAAEIYDNLIERTADSGMEVGGPAVDVRIHHNTLRRTHGGLRYKLPRIGPVFIYRNLLEEGSPFNIWYSMDASPAEGYVYHNTVVGGQVALLYHIWPKHHEIGAPHWHYLNNLFITRGGAFLTRDTRIPVNFTWDYNVVVGNNRPFPHDPAKDRHSRYVGEVTLGPGSPAAEAGLDLSTYFHGQPLPGCEPGYFKGKAPDAGASPDSRTAGAPGTACFVNCSSAPAETASK
jgi:hypothetical protein